MALSQLILESIRRQLASTAGFTTASNSIITTMGSINAGSNILTIANVSTFNNGQYIKISGAGTGGSKLLTWITNKQNNELTLYDKAIMNVNNVLIEHDDRACVPAANIKMADGNYPVEYPAVVFKMEGGTAFDFIDSMSGYLWIYIYIHSLDNGKGQPVTILNLISDRIKILLHCQENNISNASIRMDRLVEAYRGGIIPEMEINKYIHSQAIRYIFIAHQV